MNEWKTYRTRREKKKIKPESETFLSVFCLHLFLFPQIFVFSHSPVSVLNAKWKHFCIFGMVLTHQTGKKWEIPDKLLNVLNLAKRKYFLLDLSTYFIISLHFFDDMMANIFFCFFFIFHRQWIWKRIMRENEMAKWRGKMNEWREKAADFGNSKKIKIKKKAFITPSQFRVHTILCSKIMGQLWESTLQQFQ